MSRTLDVTAIITAMTDDEKPFLSETIESVLSDPCIGQAIICIDEKNTWLDSIIHNLKDDRLCVVKMPLAPIGVIRNNAVAHVKSPWIAYCDGDDLWCKGKTSMQRKYAEETGADLVGAGHYLINESGKICAYGFSIHIAMPSTWLVKADIMRRFQFNEDVFQGSDGEWWIKTGGKIKKEKCPHPLAKYRVRTQSVSSASYSKRRKLKLVTLASIPLFGLGVYFLSYCYWLYTRNKKYKWLSEWTEWILIDEADEMNKKNN